MSVEYLKELFYPSVHYVSDDAIFYNWIKSSLNPDSIILDLGAGGGLEWKYDFKDLCKKVVGIDIDPVVADNPNLDEAIISDFFKNDFKSNLFDVVFANFVVEHIKRPYDFLVEIKRILKRNGVFYFRTLSKYHYANVAARLTPYWFHVYYARLLGRKEEDVFPTFYKMNSKRDMDRISKVINLKYEIKMFEGYAGYLQINPIFFLLGVAYERIVNHISIFSRFKGILMCKIVLLDEGDGNEKF